MSSIGRTIAETASAASSIDFPARSAFSAGSQRNGLSCTPPDPIDPKQAIAATESWWQDWSSRCTYHGRWRDAVMRSLITLKALTFAPTGGIVAAATTSLPEHLGGVRNWDYRFCWLRDATFTLLSLLNTGYMEEARALGGDLDLRRRASLLGALAISYRETGDLEASVTAGAQSLALWHAANAVLEEALLSGNLALTYLKVGNLDKADELLASAGGALERLGDRQRLAANIESQAQVALERGDTKKISTLLGSPDIAPVGSETPCRGVSIRLRSRSI